MGGEGSWPRCEVRRKRGLAMMGPEARFWDLQDNCLDVVGMRFTWSLVRTDG